MKENRVAFLMLFFGMVLVKRRNASLSDTLSMLPLSGRGRLLALEMDRSGTALWQGLKTGNSLHGDLGHQTFCPADGQA